MYLNPYSVLFATCSRTKKMGKEEGDQEVHGTLPKNFASALCCV